MYERGVKIFKYPHTACEGYMGHLSVQICKEIRKKKLERARELFEHAVDTVCILFSFQIFRLVILLLKYYEHGLFTNDLINVLCN